MYRRAGTQIYGEVQSGEARQRGLGVGLAHFEPFDPTTGVSEASEGLASEV